MSLLCIYPLLPSECILFCDLQSDFFLTFNCLPHYIPRLVNVTTSVFKTGIAAVSPRLPVQNIMSNSVNSDCVQTSKNKHYHLFKFILRAESLRSSLYQSPSSFPTYLRKIEATVLAGQFKLSLGHLYSKRRGPDPRASKNLCVPRQKSYITTDEKHPYNRNAASLTLTSTT